ncbi:MAG: serine/threonine-protein phosphatase, partial [Chloroflexi bacterium]|nr:serine/threonine-protein phosphatase [Chloroflexota bacterium]
HMFLTAGYAKLDPQTGHLTYADGGHNPALVFRAATRTVERLKPHGMLLGAFLEIACEELTAHLDAGDILLLYTDGITEALNERQEEYGEDRLMEMLAACADQPAVEIRDAIVASVTAFAAGTPPADDLTLFVAKRRSGAR